jgi:hypothetical protein
MAINTLPTTGLMPRVYGRGPRHGRAAPRCGFTLIETALATVIVGTGVLAMVVAQQAFHTQNSWSSHVSIAQRLGNEIREMTLNLPRQDPVTGDAYWGPEPNEAWVGDFDDLDDFDGEGAGLIFDPPINALRTPIANMDGWSQEVTVFNVDPFDINSVQVDGSTDMIVVQVIVKYQGPNDNEAEEVTRVIWISPN